WTESAFQWCGNAADQHRAIQRRSELFSPFGRICFIWQHIIAGGGDSFRRGRDGRAQPDTAGASPGLNASATCNDKAPAAARGCPGGPGNGKRRPRRYWPIRKRGAASTKRKWRLCLGASTKEPPMRTEFLNATIRW